MTSKKNALVLLVTERAPRPVEWKALGKVSSERPDPQRLYAMALEHPGIQRGAAA
jgi:hypothetical protein